MQVSLSRHRVAATVALGVIVALACAGTGTAATAKQSLPRFPFCSWWFETTPQNPNTNVALPDTSAAYWTTPFFADPGLKITMKGQFPNARFMSVNVYNNSGGVFTTSNGVESGVSDFQVAPDRGTRNPFQQRTLRNGRFTLTIQRHVSPSQTNVLPLVPSTPTKGNLLPPGFGFIIYRVYLPHSGDFNSVRLPTLIFARHGGSQTLPRCSDNPKVKRLAHALLSRISKSAAAMPKFPPTSGAPAFARPLEATTNRLFPNVANAYVAAPFSATPGTVVVVQAKAPTFTPDSTALPWPNPAYNLRYWSLCNNEDVSPYPVVDVTDPQTNQQIFGCSADLNTPIVNGQYTYVLSSLAERPPNTTTADGVAWLPYSNDQVKEVLIMRNMLGDGFPNSVQNVNQDGDPASAQAAMGAYYPRFAQCSVSTFTQGGPSACFAAGG